MQSEAILVTGAGGSIGSALALRLANFGCEELVLLESSESSLFTLRNSLSATIPDGSAKLVLGSVLDHSLMDEIFDLYEPGIIFHAAAHKQVPLLEEQPFAAIENNIFGTQSIVDAAHSRRALLVLLSTDKAVEPASVMGATKRVSEMIVLESGGTVIRLGNVLGSSGSVAQIFGAQINRGGPLTVTDPAARRYFLTIDEAVHLLIAAAERKEQGSLFVPALKAQHFIVDLAWFLARELAPGQIIPVEFTGPRPGDKEYEKLWGTGESVGGAADDGLVSIRASRIATDKRELERLHVALDARELPEALAALQSLVPEFTPSAALLSLAGQRASRVAP